MGESRFDLHSVNNCALPPSPCIRCCQRSGQFKPTQTEHLAQIIIILLFYIPINIILHVFNADAKLKIEGNNDIIARIKMQEI